jgi:hypothetical protein
LFPYSDEKHKFMRHVGERISAASTEHFLGGALVTRTAWSFTDGHLPAAPTSPRHGSKKLMDVEGTLLVP